MSSQRDTSSASVTAAVNAGVLKSMSRIRIADDPDSWGTPQISSIEPVKSREDPSKCSGCGVDWMHHLADLCPIPRRKLSD